MKSMVKDKQAFCFVPNTFVDDTLISSKKGLKRIIKLSSKTKYDISVFKKRFKNALNKILRK